MEKKNADVLGVFPSKILQFFLDVFQDFFLHVPSHHRREGFHPPFVDDFPLLGPLFVQLGHGLVFVVGVVILILHPGDGLVVVPVPFPESQ